MEARQVLEADSARAEELRREATSEWARDRQAAVQAEIAKTERVLFVDQHADVELAQHHKREIMGWTVMQPWKPGEQIGGPALLEELQAGCEAVAWFSQKVDLQTYGGDLRGRVKQWLPEGQKLRFILEVAPEEWDGAVPTFDKLWKTATPTLPRKPKSTASNNEEAPFDTSPAEIARRIVRRFGDQLLVVAPPQHDPESYSTGFALASNGLWLPGGDPWARWLRIIAEEMKAAFLALGPKGRSLLNAALTSIDRVKTTALVEKVRSHLRAELDDLRDAGEPCDDVTECAYEDLDADVRYVGAGNGVVDLHTGQRLPPEEGRRCLVTRSVPVDFDPAATHPAVDRLFSHLGPEVVTWWWQVLGRGLRGPTKRLYAGVGEPNGGKSTLLKALLLTLGPYARKAARGVLSTSNRSSETQLSPGLLAWLAPARFVLVEEEKRRQTLDSGLVKDLTGMGFLSARGMRENLRQGHVTATTIMFSNTDSVPRLSLETEGMQDRYRELPYAKVPVIDLAMSESVVQDPAFQTAFFARMVWWAARTPEPPDDIPLVNEATRDRIREDMGEVGAFAQRVVRGGNVLTLDEAWRAWCEFVQAPGDSSEAGGLKRLRFSSTLRDYVTGLPAAKLVSVDGSKVRGWRGWQLLSVDEAEQAAAAQQAEETEPPYEPGPEADRAIRDLLTDFPDDFTVLGVTLDRRTLAGCLFGVRNDDRLLALRNMYKTGSKLAEHLQKISESVAYQHDLEDKERPPVRMTSAESMRRAYPDLGDNDLAAGWLDNTISMLAWAADRTRPVGRVYEQAQARFGSLGMTIQGRENVALNVLFEADRRLSGGADVKEMVETAVELLVAELNRIPPEEAADYDVADIEAVIKELVGLKDRAPAGHQRSMDQGGEK